MYTRAVVVVILVPPAAPTTKIASPFSSTTTLGHIDDMGLFPGTIKFDGDGGTPNLLIKPGAEKSSISSFKMIPVLGDLKPAPKLEVINDAMQSQI